MSNVQDDPSARKRATLRLRRFLGIGDDEPTELAIFRQGRIFVGQPTTSEAHVRLLAQAERTSDVTGVFQVFNGIDRRILARYKPDAISYAYNHRAADGDITLRRAVYVDIDAVRPKGISSTASELTATREVCCDLRAWLVVRVGSKAVGHGCSGNGHFILIAIEPTPPTPEDTAKIARLLRALQAKFGNECVKIDQAVANPSRLMPAPGTWKRKGQDWPDRPHRLVTFFCSRSVERVPLSELIG